MIETATKVTGGFISAYFGISTSQYVMILLVIFGILCFLAATNRVIHVLLWSFEKLSGLLFWLLFCVFILMGLILLVDGFFIVNNFSEQIDPNWQTAINYGIKQGIENTHRIIQSLFPQQVVKAAYTSFHQFLDIVANVTKPQ